MITAIVIICSSSLATSFAINNEFNKNMVFSSESIENDYKVFRFDIDKTFISDFTKNNTNLKKDYSIYNSNNILSIMENIQSLEIPNDLKTYYLDELENIKDQKGILKDYSIYIPKDFISNSGINIESYSEGYYGSYNGQSFRAAFSVYNRGYDVSSYDSTKIQNWIGFGLSLLLNFTPKFVSVPATIFESGSNPPYAHELTSPHLYLYVSEEVTSRQILMKDFMTKIVVNPDQYVAVLADQAKIVSIDAILFNNNPYFPPEYIGRKGPEQITTTNFYNPSTNMRNAYDNYVGGYFPSWFPNETLPKGSMSWR